MKSLLFAFAVILLDAMGCSSRHDEPDLLYVSPDALMLENQKGASGVIPVSSNRSWRVVSKNGQWLEIIPESGDGDEMINIIARSSNESTSSRSCTLIIDGKEIQREVVVIQKGE